MRGTMRWLMMALVVGTSVAWLFGEEADRPRDVAKHGVVLIAGDTGDQPVRPKNVGDRSAAAAEHLHPAAEVPGLAGEWSAPEERAAPLPNPSPSSGQ